MRTCAHEEEFHIVDSVCGAFEIILQCGTRQMWNKRKKKEEKQPAEEYKKKKKFYVHM